MKESLRHKIESMAERHEELSRLLASPDTLANQELFKRYSIEYSQLEPLASAHASYRKLLADRQSAQAMSADPEFRALAEEELEQTQQRIASLEEEFLALLVPRDPRDDSNVFLEIRAAAGGDEAAIFAGDLFRMYARYAERVGWQVEILSRNEGEHGGYKEIISRVSGRGAYARLKFESGAHRVQRVPATEAQGRIHTSTATVVVMPEVDEVEEVTLNPADLRVDTYRASGAGGQHVNKTDSAIRITHLPTGIVVECQDERSQHKNRARAMSHLRAKLLQAERDKQTAEQTATRRTLVGTGDRSERIRTYNFPQGRITDHRINLTLYKLEDVVEGDLDPLLSALAREHQADLLSGIAD